MTFLSLLADQINNQYSIGENDTTSLDAVGVGQNQQFGSLGDYAGMFNQSTERKYVEEGYLRRDPYTSDPKLFKILLQEPSATVLIKKSMFSSINENYRPDFMDKDEKMYYKAMKILFQNKCRQIAVLEKLSKIQKVTAAVGNVSDQLLPIIIGLTDSVSSEINASGPSLFGGSGSNGDIVNFTKVIERIRRLYAFNNTNQITTWITDSTNLFQSQLAQGTGVIEITNFTSLSTTTTTDLKNAGGFSFDISDPYESMLITDYDIEKAISDATNAYYNHKIYQFGQNSTQQTVNQTQAQLGLMRSTRGVSPIEIITAPDILLGQRVSAILTRTGIAIEFSYVDTVVVVAPAYLQGGVVAGIDGLSLSEMVSFQQVIDAVYSQIQANSSSQNSFQATNKMTNYARRKMMFQFMGKVIIQPMDVAHIYINSKSRFDGQLLNGIQAMFAGFGILQSTTNTPTDLTNANGTLFNPSQGIQMQAEKAAFVGPDFPSYLWALLRNQFVTEKEGTHVAAGVVESAPSNWSDGKFTISVRGKDNTSYFDLGKVNWKPGVDVFNGPLFDPLTPFRTTFDTITSNAKSNTPELLDENKWLLGLSSDGTSPLAKSKLGPNAGLPAHSDNLLLEGNIDKVTGSPTKVYYAPDGLVYKWKEGIGVLVQFGSSLDINDPSKIGNPAITKEPFAGQDVMNVLSLLITGQPYNFATYWQTVSNFDGFNRDPQSQQDSAYSYYASLRTDLTKNNITWGNFIPYKNLVMDEQTFAKAMQGQIAAVNRNNELDSLIQQLATAKNNVALFGSAHALTTNPGQQTQYTNNAIEAQNQATQLSIQINAIINNKQASTNLNSNQIGAGGDPSFASGASSSGNNPNSTVSDASQRQSYRRQLNYLTRRMSYNVRANEDKNLFIVDDTYDKDYDIIAYEESLADGIKLYNNEFESVRGKIIATAELLNLEVFADSQGHIRVRSPQYNRMPSSVFYRMLYLNKAYGIQIFPQFLNDLFQTQVQTLTNRVEVLENQIRLDCAVLGFNTDADCEDFILNGDSDNASVTQGTTDAFAFISDEASFRITNYATLINQANPDATNQAITSLAQQANGQKQVFTNSQRYQYLASAYNTGDLNQQGYSIQDVSQLATNPRLNALIQIIKTDTGQQIPNDYFISSNNAITNAVNTPLGQTIDVFKVTKDLSGYIKQRQQALKQLYSSIKNAIEVRSLDDNINTGNQMLNPGNYGNSNVPEIFEHMIEDETYDDYGPGSGTRYIIKRAQIKNINITEVPPDFTYVEVKGQINPLLPSTVLPGELDSFPQGGNGLVTAAAVDYDLWRKFGHRQAAPINVPFLSDPNNQCAPYASMILSRARKNILRGSVTIVGNEFMQPGEVVFLQDRQMLFYVTSVRHSYSFSSTSFTTTLELSYGHTPGDYIPTTLDVIGKLIYSNRDLATTSVQRQSNAYNTSNMGVIVSSPQIAANNTNVLSTGSSTDTSNNNPFTASNGNTINNILYQAAYMINANSTKGNTVEASIELRMYYSSKGSINGGAPSETLTNFAESVLQALSTPHGAVQKYNSTTSSANNTPPIPVSNISILPVDMDAMDDPRSPSQKAIDMARNMIGQNSVSGGGTPLPTNTNNASGDSSQQSQQDQIRVQLFNYVIDCWLTFSQVPANIAQSTNPNSNAQSGT